MPDIFFVPTHSIGAPHLLFRIIAEDAHTISHRISTPSTPSVESAELDVGMQERVRDRQGPYIISFAFPEPRNGCALLYLDWQDAT